MDNYSSILISFLDNISHDPRIGVSHISLFCALVKQATMTDDHSILVKSNEVMKVAKISGLGTYHKCIRELNDYGYIKYRPSYDHRRKSKVDFVAPL